MDVQEYELLISEQNSRRQKYMGLVQSVLEMGSGVASVVESFDEAFDVDNAAGAQLDIIGDLVGVKRLLDYAPSVGDREMSDDEYRTCIRMAVARNEWDGSNAGVFEAYRVLEASGVGINYLDNQNMTVTLNIVDALSVRMYEILRNIGVLLVPAGVDVEFEFSGTTVMAASPVSVGISAIEEVIDVHADGGD